MAPHNLPNIEHREVTAIDEETGEKFSGREIHLKGSDSGLEKLPEVVQAGIRLARKFEPGYHFFIEPEDTYRGPISLDEHSIPVIERQRQGEHSPNYAMPENDF